MEALREALRDALRIYSIQHMQTYKFAAYLSFSGDPFSIMFGEKIRIRNIDLSGICPGVVWFSNLFDCVLYVCLIQIFIHYEAIVASSGYYV